MQWCEAPLISLPPPLPDLHPLVARTLLRRGITTPAQARAFLDPFAYSSSPPNELPGLSSAVDRVEQAIHGHQDICVWGDFDVDGQTSTAILYQSLKELGASVIYHIPVRESEGHGISI